MKKYETAGQPKKFDEITEVVCIRVPKSKKAVYKKAFENIVKENEKK